MPIASGHSHWTDRELLDNGSTLTSSTSPGTPARNKSVEERITTQCVNVSMHSEVCLRRRYEKGGGMRKEKV